MFMSDLYTPTVWVDDKTVATATIMNNMEKGIVNAIKGVKLTVIDFNDISEAIVTAGGVKVTEINPKTMESKICKGLYFAGEVIDCDGYTGGFNLQIAFSTGHLAGISASNINEV